MRPDRLAPPPSPVRHAVRARRLRQNIATFINSNTGGSPTAGLLPSQALPNLGGRILRNGCDRLANGQTTVGPAIPTPLRCFPEDYLVANPQFATANYNTNTGSSNYHSLETQITVRPTPGTSVQATYTWAKSMELPGTGWTDPLDRDADYRIASNNRGHELRMNGMFELPMGPNKLVLGNSSGALARVIENWRVSWTANVFSGAPATIGAQSMLYGNGTPDVVGPWDVNGGKVHWGENIGGQGLGGTYFGSVGTYKVVTDPACAPGGLLDTTDKMGFNIRTGVTNGCPLTAIADSSNQIVLQNPAPGKRGTLGQQTIIGPGSWTMDGSLSKQFRITESKSGSASVRRHQSHEPSAAQQSAVQHQQLGFRNDSREGQSDAGLPGAVALPVLTMGKRKFKLCTSILSAMWCRRGLRQ